MDSWADNAIWWQVYPLGFVGAERVALPPGSATEHRLPLLERWLDYLIELGCNGLLLNPIFLSESHGYDIVDHFAVDPRLGDDADVDSLIAACRSRGIMLMFDGVFNHVGRAFEGFVDVLANGSSSRWADWFDIDWHAEGPDGFAYRDFEGHGGLVALNHENPEVADYTVSVMEHWLERGIDGWRLDAAYAVPLPFWRSVTDRVRARFPQAWFVGEVIHGEFSDWVTKGGLDSVTQYELWKATWSSLNDRNFHELNWTLGRHQTFCESLRPLTFLGNHDVTRLASQLTDIRHLGHALVVLFTMPGIPCVYYGDEQAFRGVKEDREGGDDAVRPAFPPGPELLSKAGWLTYRLHQRLIGLRRQNAWLTRASVEVVSVSNERFAYRLSAPGAPSDLLVLLNVADEEFDLAMDGAVEVLLRDGRTPTGDEQPGGGEVGAAPHGWAICRVVG